MNTLPLSRRKGFVALIGIGFASAFYYINLRASGEAAVPPTYFANLALIVGLFITLSLAIFSFYHLLWFKESKQWIGAFLRFVIFSLWAGGNFMMLIDRSFPLYRELLTHLASALVALLLTISLTAQFVLPVRTPKERLSAIRRLLGFFFGERGPVTFIRNGEILEAHGERRRRGPGVFLIDHASAAVLRTDTEFTRAVGPGLVFSSPGERLGEALDLRAQVRMVQGFTPPTGAPSELDITNSLAITKDGIPVSTDLTVTFILEPRNGEQPEDIQENRCPHEYNREAVEKAVYGHAYGEFEDLPWTKLPLRLIIDLWREIVKEKSLKELTSHESNQVPPLAEIKHEIQYRLNPHVAKKQEGSEQSDIASSREYEVLSSRGIRVLDVSVSHLYLPDNIRHERMAQWHHTWASDIQAALSDAKEIVYRATLAGESEASYYLFYKLTSTLHGQIKRGQRSSKRDTLKQIFDDAIELCGEEDMVEDGTTLAAHLVEIAGELARLDEDCQEPETGGGP